jgi:hypothetical protein
VVCAVAAFESVQAAMNKQKPTSRIRMSIWGDFFVFRKNRITTTSKNILRSIAGQKVIPGRRFPVGFL